MYGVQNQMRTTGTDLMKEITGCNPKTAALAITLVCLILATMVANAEKGRGF